MKTIVEVNDNFFKKGFLVVGELKREEIRLFCKKNRGKLLQVEFTELKE